MVQFRRPQDNINAAFQNSLMFGQMLSIKNLDKAIETHEKNGLLSVVTELKRIKSIKEKRQNEEK